MHKVQNQLQDNFLQTELEGILVLKLNESCLFQMFESVSFSNQKLFEAFMQHALEMQFQ